MESEGEEDGLDEETIANMPAENKQALEAQFLQVYQADAGLREALSGARPESLSLYQKYQIMMQYGDSKEPKRGGQEVVTIEGKQYTKVQIEGHEDEFLMDAANNIYDLNLKLVGVQGDSDEDDF